MKIMQKALFSLSIVCVTILGGCQKQEPATQATEIYLVRHFQKQANTANGSQDVALTEQGKANARNLAQHLRDENISKIYSTDYVRTKQTALPLSEALNVPITLYNANDLSDLAELVLTHKDNLLIVGHSNTTGQLFGLLGCQSATLTEQDYGDIFVVKLHKDESATLLECSRYQLPDTAAKELTRVKQNKLQQYWQQTNKQFTFQADNERNPAHSGWVEVGFIIDENGLLSDFEIVASDPLDAWHEHALQAAKQLHFDKQSIDQTHPNIYTTWLFHFTAP